MLVFFVPAWLVLARTVLRLLRVVVGVLLELTLLVLWVLWMGLRLGYRTGRRLANPFWNTRKQIRDLPEI